MSCSIPPASRPCRAAVDALRRQQAVEVARTIRPETVSMWEALREVRDPEIPVSVVDLGLICDIRRSAKRVEVDVTFTSTACPAVSMIKDDIRMRLLREADVDSVEICETWEINWTASRISPDGRQSMRAYGIAL